MKAFKGLIALFLICGNLLAGVSLVFASHSDRLDPEINILAPYFGLAFPLFLSLIVLFLVYGMWKSKFCVVISLLSIAASFNAIHNYFPLSGQLSDPPKTAFKVMTYNIGGYKLGSKTNHETTRIINFIRDENPDICCLQEGAWIDKKNKTNERIPHKQAFKKYKYTHFAQFEQKNWGRKSCLILLSKYPIKSAREVVINSNTNASMQYELDVNGKTVTVFNNHLQSNQFSTKDRRFYAEMLGNPNIDQIKQTRFDIFKKYGRAAITRKEQAQLVRNAIDKAKGETIVCGDFNDTQLSYAYRLIQGTDLSSAFTEAGFGPGITYNSHLIYFRIDHILHTQGFKAHNTEVKKVFFSDHYPVVTHLTMK